MYRICDCEDFPCCGHGFGDELEDTREFLSLACDPFLDDFWDEDEDEDEQED